MEFSLWNYGSFDSYYGDAKSAVAEWKELGITTGFSFYYEEGEENKRKMLALLDECAAAGIRVIMNDPRTGARKLEKEGEKAFAASVARAASDFGHHPAVWAWFVGDEPDKGEFALFRRAAEIISEETPNKPFVNFYPYGMYLKEQYSNSQEAYMKDVEKCAEVLPLLAFDRYAQCFAADFENNWKWRGLEWYFSDLNAFAAGGKRLGVPCWLSALAVGHWNYRTPTQDDIRWQISTAFAHGMQGIQWFFPYQHRYADDYFGYAIYHSGHKSELYYHIVNETKSFKVRIEERFQGYRHQNVWHISKSYADTPRLKNDSESDYFVVGLHEHFGILARFADDKGESKYILCNGEQSGPEVFAITNKRTGDYRTVWLPPGGTTVLG